MVANKESEIKVIPIDENLAQLLHRILEQNEIVLKLNQQIISALELPMYIYRSSESDSLREKLFKK